MEGKGIYHQVLSPDGKWSSPGQVYYGHRHDIDEIEIACDINGNVHLFWQFQDDAHGGNHRLYYSRGQKISGLWGGWTEPIEIDRGDFDDHDFDMTLDKYGNVHFVIDGRSDTPGFQMVSYSKKRPDNNQFKYFYIGQWYLQQDL